jgi:hypothetical protein
MKEMIIFGVSRFSRMLVTFSVLQRVHFAFPVSPCTLFASSFPNKSSANLRRNSISLSVGKRERKPDIASIHTDALSCATISVLRVGLAFATTEFAGLPF